MGCPVTANTSTAQILHLRLKEHHRSGKNLKSREKKCCEICLKELSERFLL